MFQTVSLFIIFKEIDLKEMKVTCTRNGLELWLLKATIDTNRICYIAFKLGFTQKIKSKIKKRNARKVKRVKLEKEATEVGPSKYGKYTTMIADPASK